MVGCCHHKISRGGILETGTDDDFCYKRVQTPGMSPPRAGSWAYCLFTPRNWHFLFEHYLYFQLIYPELNLPLTCSKPDNIPSLENEMKILISQTIF